MSELAKALLAFQKDAPALQRDGINPHFRSKFLSLEKLMAAVVPVANKHGLVISQMPTSVEGFPALHTRIIHADTGEELADTMLLQAQKNDPQGQGSAITYARRYALMAALGLVADEDDDGNAATRSGAGTDRTSGEKTAVGSPQDGEAGSTPAPDTPFKAPTGKRGSGSTEKLRSELVELVTQLGAVDSLKAVHAHADAGDDAWLRRQIKTAKEAVSKLEPIPFE